MKRRSVLTGLAAIFAAPHAARTEGRIPHIGFIHFGGPYAAALDGLRGGLKALGLIEGTHYAVDVHDINGNRSAIGEVARSLEVAGAALLYTVTTSVTLAAVRSTKTVPIVFYAGGDPEQFQLVESFGKPGGRLTGIHSRTDELLVKRLQLLTELNPRIRRVLIFYQAANPVAAQYLTVGREAAQQLKIEIIERPVASPEAFRASLRALRPGDADAYTNGADGMIVSQEPFVIETATALRMPTILSNKEGVVMGGLAGYGVSYSEAARLSARHVRAVLLGADPGQVPVEHYDRVGFFLNLRTAKALGLTIPESILAQAGEVIE